MSPISICWFRQDLRLDDNPALVQAVSDGAVLPLFILEDEDAGAEAMGAASRVWLHHSLHSLIQSLDGHLQIFKGSAEAVLSHLIKTHNPVSIHWNRAYEPWRISRDKELKSLINKESEIAHSHKASLLWEPWEAYKNDGTPYKVFTPFYRRGCLGAKLPNRPLPKPEIAEFAPADSQSLSIDQLNLLPAHNWHKEIISDWQIGEAGAHQRLETFLDKGISNYAEGRNFPAKAFISRLSPHLHFGEISPARCWHSALDRFGFENKNADVFLSELGWREFSHSLLYHNPTLKTEPLNQKFNHFPWRQSDDDLRAWQQGMTGYPIVDAGMRELYQTGYMHNRVRMIVGSFLVKNLRLHWMEGEKWFWDCLFDADHANNAASWQWIAGCGADAAPYFRVFNPITQAEKFDPDGDYIKKYVPELRFLPLKYIGAPFAAPPEVLRSANITLGKTYPHPIVDAKQSRLDALAAFATLKEAS